MPKYLSAGDVNRRGLALIVGESGAGKTHFAHALAADLAVAVGAIIASLLTALIPAAFDRVHLHNAIGGHRMGMQLGQFGCVR